MRAVVGTAGHIDHGKSALVRALTGIDPDRLPEERERGISIELGFAHMETPEGGPIGFVDVPGHERFVRHMLAGAQGFDYVLVVVAADDGVMPQTEEHFEICHLLGLEHGAFVITKTDLVPAIRLDDVRAEIELLAEGTTFARAPVFAVSAISGDGISALREHLVSVLPGVERTASDDGPFRLPVDRVFVLKGHGVVVTGTAAGGAVAAGDEVAIAPKLLRARVREVQVHGRSVPRAGAGQRVALNLAGIDHADVARGDTVVAGDAASGTERFDARVEVRPAARRALRSHERVRLHLGTSELPARLIWLGGESSVAPKQSALAQIVMGKVRVVAFPGDRFVLRDETGVRTIGGGRVLLVDAPRHRRRDAYTAERLANLETADAVARVAAYLELCDGLGATTANLVRGVGMSQSAVTRIVADETRFVRMGADEGTAVFVAGDRYQLYTGKLLARVQAHHETTTSAPGLEIERLRQTLEPLVDSRLFRAVLDRLCGEGRLERRGGSVAVPGHTVRMSPQAERVAEAVLGDLRAAGATPPSLLEMQERHRVGVAALQEVLGVLTERGEAIKVSSELYFARDAVALMGEKLRRFLEREGRITPAGFRDLIEASRKYTIPLLDYFDRSGLTVRAGDYRRLQ